MRRTSVSVTLAVATTMMATLATAEPAAAHGVGERADLPLPLWLFTYGAAAVLLASFVALRALWPKPRLRRLAAGHPLRTPGRRLGVVAGAVALRAVGLLLFAVTLTAAFLGDDSPTANVAPVAVYVVFWVGVQVASAFLGNVWSALNPLDTLAALATRARVRIAKRSGPEWTAAPLLFSFVWLELAYHDPASPRAVGWWMLAYTVVALAGAARWGRGWLRTGEGFSVLFGLLARMAPLYRERLKLRARPPVAGLATTDTTNGTTPGVLAVLFVLLGSTAFDGVSRTQFWIDVLGARTGWSLTVLNTVGLVWVIGLVAAAYLAATRVAARVSGRDPSQTALDFGASLVPIALAYSVAHYFSLLVFEGQSAIALASDPYGRGWDLFGTAANTVDYGAVSPDLIAYVQAGAIVLGHVAGVVVAHDRAVELWPRRLAERTQYAMLAVMVAYTVGGLAILLGA